MPLLLLLALLAITRIAIRLFAFENSLKTLYGLNLGTLGGTENADFRE